MMLLGRFRMWPIHSNLLFLITSLIWFWFALLSYSSSSVQLSMPGHHIEVTTFKFAFRFWFWSVGSYENVSFVVSYPIMVKYSSVPFVCDILLPRCWNWFTCPYLLPAVRCSLLTFLLYRQYNWILYIYLPLRMTFLINIGSCCRGLYKIIHSTN